MTDSPTADGGGDELPEDLQTTLADQEDYIFPNNNRRRVPGYMYLVCAVALVVIYYARPDGVFVNSGFVWAAVMLAAFGAYHIVSGWDLAVDEQQALVVAAREIGQPVGPASAQLSWRGLRSRPVWRILAYTAEDPPLTRALVVVDGVDGHVVERIVEDNPEDWEQVTAAP